MSIHYGNNIKLLRKDKGLDQKAFGEVIGKSRAVISSYERQDAVPPLEVFADICAFFKVSMDDMYYKDMEKDEVSGLQNFEINDPEEKYLTTLSGDIRNEIINIVREEMKNAKR